MALSRVKTWVAEVLTFADLNAEFDNVLNNPISLISPATAAIDMNGFELILDADADTSITSDTDDRIDFRIGGTDSAFMGHATGNTGGFFTLDTLAFTSTANTDIARFRIGNTNALTVPAGTTAIAATAFFEEPNLTATGTITNAATVYIEAAPTEGGTANYALWVDAGDVRFDGSSIVTGTTMTFAAAATTLNIGAATGTTTPAGSWCPQNSQSAAYTTVAADANKVILHPAADNNARTFTIDSNANVPYPIGTIIGFDNQVNTVTIAITADTLVLAGAGSTGSRTLSSSGIAFAIKEASTTWKIFGHGLT